MTNGFNRFDVLYYINIEQRKDRQQHILQELSKTNIDSNKINRIDAVYIPECGQLGCSKSHIKALEMFLQTDDKIQNCIILEDDFQFILPQATVNYMLDKFFNDIEQFDILMLSYNSQGHKNTNYNYLIRIDWAFSLSGYCVNKQYARRLLENYKNGAEKLEYEFKNTGHKNREYYIDVYNQQLICESIWYGFIPRLGKQIQSYSDIEKTYVDYNL